MASPLEGPVTRRRRARRKASKADSVAQRQSAAAAAASHDDSKDSPPEPEPPAAAAAARRGTMPKVKKRRRKEQLHPTFRSDPNENPRQISTSLFLAGTLLAVSVLRGNDNGGGDGTGDVSSIRPAVLATFLSFLTLSYLQTRDLILTFPHPGFWRLVFGACAFYTLCMVALLHLDRNRARDVLHGVFPDIGTQEEFDDGLRTRIDAVMGTCQLSTAALARQLFHCPWVLAHAVGWMAKMLVFRDFRMAFFAAVVFEVMEVSLMHAVPEFEECWWDSLFLDTLGANLLGMYMGDRLNEWMRRKRKRGGDEQSVVDSESSRGEGEGGVGGSQRLSVKTELGSDFDWVGRGAHMRPSHSSRRPLWLLSPVAAPYQWKIFSSLGRLLRLGAAAFFVSLLELNSFLLINAFGIANNTSWFVLFRLVVVGLLGVPGGAEWYDYVTQCDRVGDGAVVRLGPSLWLLFCTAAVEVAVSYKFFPRHMSIELERAGNVTGIPYNVLVPHLISMCLVLAWIVLKYKVRKATTSMAVDNLLILASIPIGYMFYMGWKWD